MNRLFLQSRRHRGFTIAELSVVMLLTTIITGVLVAFWMQARVVLERGVAKTTLQHKVRMAATRVIPRVVSVSRRPPTADDIEIKPIIAPEPDGQWHTEVIMNTTRAFIKDQLREPVVPDDEFNPRGRGLGDDNTNYGRLRIWFEWNDTDHPELGKVGDLMINRAPDDPEYSPSDDIVLVRDLSFVGFKVTDERRVRFRVVAKHLIPLVGREKVGEGANLETQLYETDIYLPVYTNVSGGAEAED